MLDNSPNPLLGLLVAAPTAVAKNKDPEHDPDQIGSRDVANGINFYSIEREIGLGKQMAQETERQAKLLDDATVGDYVSRLVRNIVNNSDAKVPFTLRIIDSDEVNAFALPGGFMFVNTCLILKADNEAELAGVLAHARSPTWPRAIAPARLPAAGWSTTVRSR